MVRKQRQALLGSSQRVIGAKHVRSLKGLVIADLDEVIVEGFREAMLAEQDGHNSLCEVGERTVRAVSRKVLSLEAW